LTTHEKSSYHSALNSCALFAVKGVETMVYKSATSVVLLRRFIAVAAAVASCFLLPNSSKAGDIKLAVPLSEASAVTFDDDPFLSALRTSKDLAEVGIKVVPTGSKEALDDVLSGRSEASLVSLGAFENRKFKGAVPTLFTAFTRPFLYDDTAELFAVQDTPLGSAVLADIGRTGVFALKFWNRGVSRIVSTQPVDSVTGIRGLKVAFSDAQPDPTLSKLGANLITIQAPDVWGALGTGAVEAAVVEPHWVQGSFWSNPEVVKIKLYVTDFRPFVGVLAISPDYWETLAEREKQAWKRAADYAAQQSFYQIKAIDSVSEKLSTVYSIKPSREQKLQLLLAAGGWNTDRAETDLNSVEVEKAHLKGVDRGLKKKQN
jgi:TRAP-type C4-dicarboxylate transport system substrate-binding protein